MDFGFSKKSTSGSTPAPTPAPEGYVRPSDWLPLPAVNDGEQKLVGLVAVYQEENSNLFSIRCSGAFTVNVYGLNNVLVSSTNFATGVKGELNLSYADFPDTECSRGYRQAIIEVVPQSGQNLTSVQLHERHTLGGSQIYGTNWLDMRVAGSSISTFTLRGTAGTATNITIPRHLEQFEWVGNSAIVSFSNMLQDVRELSNLIGTAWTANGTTFSTMFSSCSSLQTIPLLNTANGTNFSSMFNICSSLQTIPLLNTANGTNFSNMFNICQSLQTIPLINTANGTNFTSMFGSCSSLQTIPLLSTANGTTFTNMFSSCSSLQTIPLLNTANGTNFSSMFGSCSSLQTIPLINTANGTTFNSMFNSCSSLQTIPLLNTANGTNFNSMFSSCQSLQTIPLINTANGTTFTSMFGSCQSLRTIPALSVNGVTLTGNWGTGIFTSCVSLQKCSLTPIKFTTSFSNCFLGKDELVEIFNNLITTTGQTITITGNKGASLLSAEERAIATGKGWTISG
jgi:hypothetical protein